MVTFDTPVLVVESHYRYHAVLVDEDVACCGRRLTQPTSFSGLRAGDALVGIGITCTGCVGGLARAIRETMEAQTC